MKWNTRCSSRDRCRAATQIVRCLEVEQSWAVLGVDYEGRVLWRLDREATVLRPAPGDFGLLESDSISFFAGGHANRMSP